MEHRITRQHQGEQDPQLPEGEEVSAAEDTQSEVGSALAAEQLQAMQRAVAELEEANRRAATAESFLGAVEKDSKGPHKGDHAGPGQGA